MPSEYHTDVARRIIPPNVLLVVSFCMLALAGSLPCRGEEIRRQVPVGDKQDGGKNKTAVGFGHWAHGAKDLVIEFNAVPEGSKISRSTVTLGVHGNYIWAPARIQTPSSTHEYTIAGVTPNVPYSAYFYGSLTKRVGGAVAAARRFTSTVCHIDVDADTDNDSPGDHWDHRPVSGNTDAEDSGEKLRSGETAEAVGVAIGVNDDHDQYWPDNDPWDRDMNREVAGKKNLDLSVEGGMYNDRSVDVAQLKVAATYPHRQGVIKLTMPTQCDAYDESGNEAWDRVLSYMEIQAPLPQSTAVPSITKTMYLAGRTVGSGDLTATFEADQSQYERIGEVKDIIRVTVRQCDISHDEQGADDLLEDHFDKGIAVPNGETDHSNMVKLTVGAFSSADDELFDGLDPEIRLTKLSGSGDVKIFWCEQAGTYGVELNTSVADSFTITGLQDDQGAPETIWQRLTGGGTIGKLYVTGVDSGEVVLGLEFTLNSESTTPTRIHMDTIRLFVGVDMNIDSDNNGAACQFDSPIEDDATKPGKYMMVNNDDGDNDGVPDYADGYSFESDSKYATVPTTSTFEALTVEIPESLDPSTVRLRFVYDASDPDGVESSSGTPPLGLPAEGHIRVWRKNEQELRNKAQVGNGAGDFVAPNDASDDDDYYTISQLNEEDTEQPGRATLWVEAVKPSASEGSSRIVLMVDLDGSGDGGWVEGDAVRLTAMLVDIDVDSDNDEDLSESTDPYCVEDYEEDMDGHDDKPGKIVPTNINDDDNDGIPDYIDGYALFSGEPAYAGGVAGETFHELRVSLPAPIDLSKAKIRLEFNEANCEEASRSRASANDDWEFARPGTGNLRIWTKSGGETRSCVPVWFYGSRVTPSADHWLHCYTPSDLLGSGERSRTFYIEGINPGSAQADQQIKVLVDPDGGGPADYMVIDSVRLSVAEVTFAKNANTTYGYDKYELIPTKDGKKWAGPMKDFVSVKGDTGSNTTKVTATIAGVKPSFLAFDNDASVFTASPSSASTATQEVTITGASLGSNKKLGPKDLEARINVTGNTLNYNVLGVCTYKLLSGNIRSQYKVYRFKCAGTATALQYTDILAGAAEKTTVADILRQAVIDITFPTSAVDVNNSDYDDPSQDHKNAYGRWKTDGLLYVGGDGKLTAEEKQVKSEITNLPADTCAIVYVRDVRITHGLKANVASGATVLELYSVAGLSVGETMCLEGRDGSGNIVSENVTIATNGIDAANKRITLTSGISNAYTADSGKQAWLVSDTGGISGWPIFVGERSYGGTLSARDSVLRVIAHEIGHNTGMVAHVDDTDNLMNPIVGSTTLLRYRTLENYDDGTDIKQWHEQVQR